MNNGPLTSRLQHLKEGDACLLYTSQLDRPVTAVLPGFSIRGRAPDSPPITLRALAAHHSGLPTDRLNGMWTVSYTHLDVYKRQSGAMHCLGSNGKA